MTTPHRGLFSFLDQENFVYHMRTKLPWLYRHLFRMKYGKYPETVKPGYETLHRHYSLDDFRHRLDASDFHEHYTIDKVFRSGLLIGVLTANLFELLSLIFGMRTATLLIKPLARLQEWDYFISYGVLSYNIAIRLKKH